VDPDLLAHVLAAWMPDAVSHMEDSTFGDDAAETSPPEDAQDALVERLSAVHGLTLTLGLRSFRGNAEQLARLLQRFAAEHSKDTAVARHYLAEGDAPSAQRTLHTLKGLAGTAGLQELQTLAAQAELALRNQEPHDNVEEALARIDPVVASIVASLHNLLQAPQPSSSEVSREALLERLGALRALLAADDLDAADAYAELREAMAQHFPSDHRALGKAIDEFALNEALKLLDTLLLRSA